MTWDEWLQHRAELRHERGVERSDPVLRDEGKIDLASNDYLGLARDERVVAAAVAATERYGAGATASRAVTGTLPVHHELEQALCDLMEWPAALALSTGYAANLAAITALVDRQTHVLLDAHVHASLHDAALMSRAPYSIFAHSDLHYLEAQLRGLTDARVIVAVESIYSVLGDAAPLTELYDVCRAHGALLVVDEAHGIGVAGGGRGRVHELGLAGAPDLVVTATMSKSLGAQGGAVLGSPAIRRQLVNTARPFIFDTGLAPGAAAAAAEAARLVLADPSLAAAMRERAQLISRICGIDASAGAVQSLPMPSPEAAVAARDQLRAEGVLVGCFRPPSVPDEISRLRITARADLPLAQVESAARLVRAVADRWSGPAE